MAHLFDADTASTGTHSKPKKCPSQFPSPNSDEPQYTKAEIEDMLRAGRWWPFDRVDGALLQALHKKTPAVDPMADLEEAPF